MYFVGTDARYAQKLLEASDSTRWMSNLRPLVADRLHCTSIPTGAPVVVTQAVAEILGENVPRGAAVFDYPFSTEARSEIIGIMLSAYLKSLEALPPSAQIIEVDSGLLDRSRCSRVRRSRDGGLRRSCCLRSGPPSRERYAE